MELPRKEICIMIFPTKSQHRNHDNPHLKINQTICLLLSTLSSTTSPGSTTLIAFKLKLFLKTFRSQRGCLIVIGFTHQETNSLGVLNHVRDEYWMMKVVKRAKVEKTKSWMTSIPLWPQSELRLWPPITSQLQAFSIRPGQVFEAERKGKGRSRIDPGSEH